MLAAKTDRQKYIDVELDAVRFFSTGAASVSLCSICHMPDNPTEEDYTIYNEAFFSWSSCDLCHDTAGGNRYPAHSFSIETGDIIHYDICETCLLEMNT